MKSVKIDELLKNKASLDVYTMMKITDAILRGETHIYMPEPSDTFKKTKKKSGKK